MVVGEAGPVRQTDIARLRVDSGCGLLCQDDSGRREAVIAKLLLAQLAQSGDDLVAEGAGGEHRLRFDQRDRDVRIEALQGTGATGAGEAAADYDNAAGGALRQGRDRRQERAGACRAPQKSASRRAQRHSFCLAYQAAIAATSSSEKPLAIRSMTVAGRCPVRNCCIGSTMSVGSRPERRGTGVCTDALAA